MNNSGYATCFDYSDDSMYSTSYSSNDDTAFNYQVSMKTYLIQSMIKDVYILKIW